MSEEIVHPLKLDRVSWLFAAVAAINCALSLLYVIAAEWLGESSISLLNQFGPATLAAGCLGGFLFLMKRYPLTIWSPLPWFLLTSSAFYGFGPLAYYFSTPETVDFMDGLYVVNERSLLRTNLLNSVCIGTMTLTAAILVLIAPMRATNIREYHQQSTKRLAWVFLALAAPVKYFLVLPHITGTLSYVLPGAIQHLSQFMGAAIILLFIVIARGEKRYIPLVALILLTEVGFGLIELSKTALMQTGLLMLLGFWLRRPNIAVVMVSGLCGALLYVTVLSPFVTFARIVIGASSAKETADIDTAMSAYDNIGRHDLAVLSPEVQGWWARLSYANVQAFAMERFDEGNRGTTFELLPYVVVPRILKSDKPLMTSGIEFTQLLLGMEDTTHTGLGFFGESYWNGGWPLVLVTCVYVASVLVVISRFAMRVMLNHEYAYMPIVLFGIQLTLTGATDWFVPTFAQGLLEVLVWLLSLYVLKELLNVRTIPRPIPLPAR